MTETGRRWCKSSFSGGGSGACVELAADGAEVLMRDSKDPDGGRLRFSRAELAAFVAACRAGEFDDLARG